MRFRAVFFDAGETLLHPHPTFPDLFAQVLEQRGHAIDSDALRDGLSLVADSFRDAARENALWTTSPERSRAFWLSVYGLFLERLRIADADGLAETLYEAFTDRSNYRLFDDVHPTLGRLRNMGAALGVVSNFEAWLELLLEDLGVTPYFSVQVISGLEGVEKPDPAIFRLALERAGVDAPEAVYVGDVPDFDVEPAAAIGMFPVLIDRRGRHPDHRGARVTDLRDLAGVLESAG